MIIRDIIQALETLAPPSYQEDYDNSGLLVGDSARDVKGVLLTLDCTEEVIAEAIQKGCNLVIAHHPIIFKGLKRLTGSNYIERTVILAIQNDIAIYACHTNLDKVMGGVNAMICARLKLGNIRILAPERRHLKKLVFFVPTDHTEAVLDAVYAAGAGSVGHYSRCSFKSEGTGTFRPDQQANPTIGTQGIDEEVKEHRVEVILPSHAAPRVMKALFANHPYEEVAYFIQELENINQEVGAGMIGELAIPLTPIEFLAHLKKNMNLSVIRYTHTPKAQIRTVAVVGGSGSFLLRHAQNADADAFVTGDYKYHDFFDAEESLMICDIGHYESEVFTKELLRNYLSEKFGNFALYLSAVKTNPIKYFV